MSAQCLTKNGPNVPRAYKIWPSTVKIGVMNEMKNYENKLIPKPWALSAKSDISFVTNLVLT